MTDLVSVPEKPKAKPLAVPVDENYKLSDEDEIQIIRVKSNEGIFFQTQKWLLFLIHFNFFLSSHMVRVRIKMIKVDQNEHWCYETFPFSERDRAQMWIR